MPKIGVLLLNTGTPEKAEKLHVAKYLREFLMDPRVIDLPWAIRWILINGIIIPSRTQSSTEAYQKIWTKEGSPLLINSLKLKAALSEKLNDNYSDAYIIELGMRYGQPKIVDAITKLKDANCNKLIILPLFPQYASASTGSAVAEVLKIIEHEWNIPSIHIVNAFYDNDDFIQIYSNIIKTTFSFPKEKTNTDFVLFSYHGLPERHIKKSNCQHFASHACPAETSCPTISEKNAFCYRAQCYTTSRLLAEKLHLSEEQYGTAFQSRLGKTPWIKPYSDEFLPILIKKGITNLWVACPSFTADCLETLEEIGIRLKEQWHALGGQNFTLANCLNDNDEWASALARYIQSCG